MKQIEFEDDIVAVYDNNGNEVERGLFDDSSYKYEDMKWDEVSKLYKLPHGYTLKCFDL